MTYDSIAVTNTLLALIAIINLIILTIVYESSRKPKEK
jgi:hypothetical protein